MKNVSECENFVCADTGACMDSKNCKVNNKTVKLKQSEDVVLELPEGWPKPGEKVSVTEKEGKIFVSKLVKVEIELDDPTFISLAKMAHEEDITLNQMINKILQEYIEMH
jgi:hypothetical protein